MFDNSVHSIIVVIIVIIIGATVVPQGLNDMMWRAMAKADIPALGAVRSA